MNAPENRRQLRRRGRGRPFAKGNTLGRRFAKGQSGNPGGRPKSEAAFREECRRVAWDLLLDFATELRSDGLLGQDPDMVRDFLEAVRGGGLLSPDAERILRLLTGLAFPQCASHAPEARR